MVNIKDIIFDCLSYEKEREWFELKENWYEKDQLGEYISSLSNSAAILGKSFAYMIWGVNDETHQITGTSFDFNVDVNNEPLCPEIYQIHAKDKIDNDKNLAWYNSKKVLIGLLVATFLCFLINLFAISQNTKGFYRELDNAVEKASPYLNIGNQTQEDIEYKGE